MKILAIILTILLSSTSAATAAPHETSCERAQVSFKDALSGFVSATDLARGLAPVIETCGISPVAEPHTTSSQADECLPAGVIVMAALFRVDVMIAGQISQSLPDAGEAKVAMIGGTVNPGVVFDGEGIAFGVLADSSGTFSFPKVAGVLLPGEAGEASASCTSFGVLCAASGSAHFTTGAIGIKVSGEIPDTCEALNRVGNLVIGR